MVASAHPVDTLGYLRDKVLDELARGNATDLVSQVNDKIMEAIAAYQQERFFFSESRDLLFSTVAGQEFYGAADNAAIPTLQAFDYMILYLGNIPWPMKRRTDIEMEVLNQNGLVRGQPYNWSYYNRQIRLGPVPDSAIQVRVAAQQTVAAPVVGSGDDTLGNPWMSGNAERLIRSRAKYELYLHTLRNQEKAQMMAAAVTEAFDTLKGQTNRLLGTGEMQPMAF